MNTSVLSKCVEELKKEKPDIRYVLGMLETFIDLSPVVNMPPVDYALPKNFIGMYPTKVEIPADEVITDEDKAYERTMAGGPIGNIG